MKGAEGCSLVIHIVFLMYTPIHYTFFREKSTPWKEKNDKRGKYL
jgi:hypothetical protein